MPPFLIIAAFAHVALAVPLYAGVDPLERGCALLKAGEYTAAVHALDAIYDPSTASPTLVANLAYGCFYQGRTDRAIELLTTLGDARPSDPLPTELLAHVMIESGNLEGADALLAQVTAPTPRMLVQRALIAYRGGRGEAARDLIGQALERDDSFAPALYNAAILQRDYFHDANAAAAAYSRLQLMAIHDAHAGLTIDEFVSRSTEAATSERDAIADAALQTMIADAEQARADGDMEAAVYHLKAAIRSVPDKPDALWALASLYATELDLRAPAVKMYTKFRQMFPHDDRLNEIPSDIMEEILAQTGPTFEELFQAGLAAYAAGDFTAAAEAYAGAFAATPTSQTSAFNLGLSRKQLGQLPAAAKAFREAIRIDASMLNSRYMLGVTEKELGNIREALTELHAVVAADPAHTLAYYVLGLIYSEQGRSAMARENLTRALDLGPEAPWAEQIKQELARLGAP